MEAPTWQDDLGSNVCKLESWRINVKDLRLGVHIHSIFCTQTLHSVLPSPWQFALLTRISFTCSGPGSPIIGSTLGSWAMPFDSVLRRSVYVLQLQPSLGCHWLFNVYQVSLVLVCQAFFYSRNLYLWELLLKPLALVLERSISSPFIWRKRGWWELTAQVLLEKTSIQNSLSVLCPFIIFL